MSSGSDSVGAVVSKKPVIQVRQCRGSRSDGAVRAYYAVRKGVKGVRTYHSGG